MDKVHDEGRRTSSREAARENEAEDRKGHKRGTLSINGTLGVTDRGENSQYISDSR